MDNKELWEEFSDKDVCFSSAPTDDDLVEEADGEDGDVLEEECSDMLLEGQ